MPRKLGRWVMAIGGMLACMLVALLAFFYLSSFRATPTLPIVTLTEAFPKNPVVSGQSVLVFGRASDPDGIAAVELWVDGTTVASQANPDPGSDQPFDASLAWIPTGPADYLVLLRATDRKGSAGQSEPVLIQAVERTYTHEVGQGETIQEIAQAFGTTPEDLRARNPGAGSAPGAGSMLDVPAAPAADGADSSGPPPEGGDAEEPPRVDPPVPAPPPSGDETPAEPAPRGYWRYLPLPRNFVCLFNPAACAAPRDDETLTPPSGVGVKLHDPCQMGVGWLDESVNEVGFRVYRVARRPFRIDMVGLLRASPGTGTRLGFLDESPPNQDLFYFIAAYNARGEAWSAPSETLGVTCASADPPAGWSLAIEALDMSVRDSYDRLYCYVSLTGSPFERVPVGGQFIQLESGSWNIARHFSGENRRAIFSDGSPVDVVAECLGWQGGTLINLGRFSRSHPREEWDGRHLTAGPSDGSFVVTYRIQPFIETEDEVGSSSWALVNSMVPPPYNLRIGPDYVLVSPDDGSGLGGHASVGVPGLAWDYTVFEGAPRPPVDFRVYYRTAADARPTLYHNTNSGANMTAPLKSDRCNETIFYSVSAVVGTDPSTGDIVESPLSEEFEVAPTCGALEITLLSYRQMDVNWPLDGEFLRAWELCFDDCGQTVEAYGYLQFNNVRVQWNDHCDGCTLGRSSANTSVPEGAVLQWSDQSLSNRGGYFGPGQNVLTLPIRDGSPLSVAFKFFDHDPVSSDDLYCASHASTDAGGYGSRTILEGNSLEQWRTVDQDFVLGDVATTAVCEITFHVRGLP